MKLKTVYLCQNCQHQVTKWLGKCPSCEAWNSFVEDVINVGKPEASAVKKKHVLRAAAPRTVERLSTVKSSTRTATKIEELDQVLGGGIVEGSLVLLSGEPGIGKSTLTLQILEAMAESGKKCLYITGEESTDQVQSRAKRLGTQHENIHIIFESSLENILILIENEKPDFLVLDSIQVMASVELAASAGSISQVRMVTESIMNTIKNKNIATLLIGHVNKDGNIAGPKVLEHLVDTVLLIEGERDRELRMLRALKNRFGTVSEVGLFEMTEAGLKELKNPGERVLDGRPENPIGSCLTISMEGNRPLLVEVQALVSKSHFGYPKRMASGFDRNRMELLIAVLNKHTSIKLGEHDVYLNISGGLTLKDPAADLAVCMAITSSFKQKTLTRNQVAWGEISLTGEVRNHFQDKKRDQAAKKLGLEVRRVQKIKEI